MKRLAPAAANDALHAFADYRYPAGDYPDGWIEGLRVVYRDDPDSAESYYQIDDASGRGDGTGEWHLVTDEGTMSPEDLGLLQVLRTVLSVVQEDLPSLGAKLLQAEKDIVARFGEDSREARVVRGAIAKYVDRLDAN